MSDRSSPIRASGDGAATPLLFRKRGLNTMYTRRQLEAVLHRERARADRNGCEFSLVLFRARAQDRRLTLRVARLLNGRARTIDELGWFDQTCIAVLLPYTSCAGARIFADRALKIAQEALIPIICRVYTYPNAWYFDGDRKLQGGGGGGSGHTNSDGGHNGNGHADGNGNGNGNGNGSGHPKSHFVSEGNGPDLGHSSGNGNGHGNGNGGGTARGDGHGNGHGGIMAQGQGVVATRDGQRLKITSAMPAASHASAPATRRQLQPSDLVPYVMQGFSDALSAPDAGADGIQTLLVRDLPWWKRAIDVAGALFGLIVFMPVMVLAAIAIKGTSRGPVIFRQRRAGLAGRPFWIYKFRTMTSDAEARQAALRQLNEQDGPAFKLTHDPRITPVGTFLRETSLDELPQLWNVLKGEMSLVGPRPLPMDESAECEQWQRRRLDVTPGLTCIWQVKGRGQVTFAEWMRMDVNYIRRRNLWHDVKILAQTIPAVLLRRGAR